MSFHPVREQGRSLKSRWRRLVVRLAAAALLLALAQAAPPRGASQLPAPASAPAPALRPRLDLHIGHAGTVEAVAFSPDGNTLASAGNDRTVKLWDVATGALQRTLADHTGLVYTIAYSPDGDTLATGSDHTVKLWEARAGGLLHTLSGHTSEVMALAFAPDRRMLASGDRDGTVRLWDVLTGKELPTLIDDPNISGTIVTLAFSPEGRTLSGLKVEDRRLEVTEWDLATGQRQGTRPLEGFRGDVRWAAFSPDASTIASGDSEGDTPRDVLLWDAQSGKLRWKQPGHTERIFGMAYSPDGKTLASAGLDGTVRLWEVETGTPVRRLKHDGDLHSVAFSPDGTRLASGEGGRRVHLWEVPVGVRVWSSRRGDGVLSVAVSPDGKRIASGEEDGSVRFWDARTGALQRLLTGHAPVAFSPDGKTLVSGSGDGTARIWDVQTGGLLRSLTGHVAHLTSVAFSPDGRSLATASADQTLRVWDAPTGRLLRTLTEIGKPVISVALSPDGQILASGHDDGSVRLWDAPTGELRRTLTGHADLISSLAFSPDGKTLASAADFRDEGIRLWNARTGALLRTLPWSRIWSLAFSPDGKTLAGAQAYSVRLWEVETGKLLQTLAGHTQEVMSVAFSPDGKRLISGSDAVRIWNPADGRLLATLLTLPPTHPEEVASDWLAITPDGYYDSSPGTARFIRWQLGDDLFPVEAYERSFRRPELVRKLLAGEAITQRPEIRRFAAGRAVPPQVTITRPRDRQTVTGDTLRVEVTVTDDRNITRVEVRVNGRPVDARPIVVGSKPITVGAKPILVGSKSLPVGARPISVGSKPIVVGSKPIPAAHRQLYPLTVEVPLPAGETRLTLKAIATDDEALQGWDELHLTRPLPAAAGRPAAALGDLYVLSIGVSRYQNPRYNLKYAAADATAFAHLWLRLEGSLYRRVVPTELTDAQATTANVRAALFKLLERATPRDTVVLFLSGHGVQAGEGRFSFATHDIDAGSAQRVEQTALPWTVFETTLAKVDAKRVFLFLDACHSGSALGDQQASTERLAEALVKRGGVLVFSSSRGGEFSYENDTLRHGAFTAALVEGIGEGKADLEVGGQRDRKITAAELLTYLQSRVPQMTGNRQTPTCPLLSDFGEAFLLARAR